MSEGIHVWLQKAGAVKYVLLVAVAGLVLLLWPSGGSFSEGSVPSDTEEAKLEAVLTQMQGVGLAEILLSEKGAVVVCQGAEDAGVCLRVTRAVVCYTGLGADKVQIFKMK